MKKRMRLRKGSSKKIFRKSASRTHERNLRDTPMRGGIRL